MAKLPETPQWEEEVYQIETSDPVLGGPNGISNRQAKQLANRTTWLKLQQESTLKAQESLLSKTVTGEQALAGAVTFAKSPTFSSGFTTLSEVNLQAKTLGANVIQRFKDMDAVEKGAIYVSSETGQMTLRWSGTAKSAVFDPDGSITVPNNIYVGLTSKNRVLTTAAPLGTLDLNTVTDEGDCYQAMTASATIARNYPVGAAGVLKVLKSRASTNSKEAATQLYYPWHAADYYYSRIYTPSTDTWSAWEIFDSRSKNDARYLQIGAYGLGAEYRPLIDGYTLASDYRVNGAWYANISIITDSFAAVNSHIFNISGHINRSYFAQLAIARDSDKIGFRRIQNNVVGSWREIWHNGNAVLDDNGFLKSAATASVSALVRTDFPVGIPQPWPTATAPSGWLKCNGATFDKAKYPLLAVAYPSGTLPDLRGEFIRGVDDSRGVDTGRVLLSAQGDAVQKFTGKTNGIQHFIPGLTPQGVISQGETVASTTGLTEASSSTGNGVFRINIDASLQIRTATETRPRNIAFNYIVRAA